MAQSPRPIHLNALPHRHQLPPAVHPHYGAHVDASSTAPRFSGPVLAPLVVPGPASGGSTLPRQHSVSNITLPHGHSRNSPTPQRSSPQPHIDARRVSTFDRLLLSQPAFVPPPSLYSSGSSYNTFERGYDRRFSTETDQDRRRSSLSTVNPSPTFPMGRPSEEQQRSEAQRQTYPIGYPPPAAGDNGDVHREASPGRSPGRYRIEVRQQPVAARACGFGERDRRVIDPPPIVQLIINDPSGATDPAEIRYPFHVVHCTLWSIDETTDETALVGADKRVTRRLMGTLVSSPFVGLDERGREGCFFCFPDLSCRTHGKYRLRFVLMRLEPCDVQPDGYSPIITETMSDIFQVFTAKEFPGMKTSTALTRALKRQGCAISVKKGNDKSTGQASGSGKDDGDGSGDDEPPPFGEEGSGTGVGKAKRRRKT